MNNFTLLRLHAGVEAKKISVKDHLGRSGKRRRENLTSHECRLAAVKRSRTPSLKPVVVQRNSHPEEKPRSTAATLVHETS